MLAVLAVVMAGCNSDEGGAEQPDRAEDATAAEPREPGVDRARCPEDLKGCVIASGTIVYVERVDPDGDGDAHFVLLSAESITAPGISVIDVARELRPHPLPEAGDRISAAGPVFRGSYDQRQIEAVEVRVLR